MNTKQSNRHAPRLATHCAECGRALPRRAHQRTCAGCVKRAQGKPRITEYDRLQGWLKASNHRA